MNAIDTAISRLLDEAAIRDATARFADTGTRADHEGFRELWAADAVWEIGEPFPSRAEGIDEILAMFRRLRDPKEFFVQFACQGAIKIDGDGAEAHSMINEVARGADATHYRTHGFYTDQLRRCDGRWLFARRTWDYLWLDTSPFPGDGFRFPRAPAIESRA